MFEHEYLVFTVVAGVTFGLALLWMLAQWFKADDAAEDVEKEVQRDIERLAQMSSEAPEGSTYRIGEPATEKPDPALLRAEVGPSPTDAQDDAETSFARLLFGWGAAGMLLGMAVGAAYMGLLGALIGSVGGSTVSILGVTVGVIIRDRVLAAKAAREKAEAEAKGTSRDTAEVRS